MSRPAAVGDIPFQGQAVTRNSKMEELNRTHREHPFGWVLTMQEMMRAVSARRLVDDRPGRREEPAAPLDDLHNLAGPH